MANHKRIYYINAKIVATKDIKRNSQENWLGPPCIGIELYHSTPPGSVEWNKLVNVHIFPILSLLLQKVETKQSTHAVAD